MNIHLLSQEVLHLRLDLEQSGSEVAGFFTQEQDTVFDTLAAWCDGEQLFIGGSLANAVVYAPLRPVSSQQRRRLRRLILSQPGIAGCQMRWRLLSSLHSVTDKAACLEAFSQAQHYLAERMSDCADALAGLVPVGPRSWRASVTDRGAMLELYHWQLQIWLAITRRDAHQDGKSVPEFARFDKQLIALADTRMLIPDWLDLHWSKVELHPRADLSVGRWQAERDGWQIWITGNPSAQLTHREVMLRWMGLVGAA